MAFLRREMQIAETPILVTLPSFLLFKFVLIFVSAKTKEIEREKKEIGSSFRCGNQR